MKAYEYTAFRNFVCLFYLSESLDNICLIGWGIIWRFQGKKLAYPGNWKGSDFKKDCKKLQFTQKDTYCDQAKDQGRPGPVSQVPKDSSLDLKQGPIANRKSKFVIQKYLHYLEVLHHPLLFCLPFWNQCWKKEIYFI